MRVVVDTNVIVSSHINETGVPGEIMNHWERRSFELVVLPMLIAEYRRALTYPHIRRLHGLSDSKLEESLAVFDEAEVFVYPESHEEEEVVTADPDDDVVIACAVAGNADYIVSGDRHLLEIGEHRGIRIVRPTVFLVVLNEGL